MKVWMLVWTAFVCSGFCALAQDDLKLDEPSAWSQLYDIRTDFGYRDNITYAPLNPAGSAYALLHLEYTLIRLPVDEWQVLFLASADGTRFFDTSVVDHELLSFSLLQVQREVLPGRVWEMGLQHVYQDQVVDAAGTVVNQGSTAIRGNTLMAYSQWKQTWASGWSLAAKPKFQWQSLQLPLDDSYAPGFDLVTGWEFGKRSTISLTYSFEDRVFSQYTPTDALGISRGRDNLHFREHNLELLWRVYLDAKKNWRLTARSGWQRQLDNGADYYGYDRVRTALDLRWKRKPWEIRLSAGSSFYNYRVQQIAGPGSEFREKELLTVGGQIRRNFRKGWYGIIKGEYEESLSNLALDRYSASLMSIGLGWEH